jgi:hypothetical protein
VPGRAGEGLHVGPVRGQRRGGVLALCGDAGLQHVIQDAGKDIGGGPVGLVLAQRLHHQSEGALDLPVGELVRAVLPFLGHAEPCLVGLGQGGERRVHLGEESWPAVSLGEHHPGQ